MSSTETATTSQTRSANAARGSGKRGGNRGRGNTNARGGNRNERPNGKAPVPSAPALPEKVVEATVLEPGDGEDNDADVCWICAEPVKYYSVSECNHRTCHVCALRLRALYKKTDCTFCKVCILTFNCGAFLYLSVGPSTICDIHRISRRFICHLFPGIDWFQRRQTLHIF